MGSAGGGRGISVLTIGGCEQDPWTVRGTSVDSPRGVSGPCVRVFEDNQGAIGLAGNRLWSARSKHIDVRIHVVRELIRATKIGVQLAASKEQHAGILTRSLARLLLSLTVSSYCLCR